MQPTGRTDPNSVRALIADGGQRNVSLCEPGLEGPQLVRMSLDITGMLMNRYRLLPLVLLPFITATLFAQEEPLARLKRLRSLKCEFGPGAHAEWKNGGVNVGSGRFGPPGEKSTIHYDAISLPTRRARVIGTGGSADLELLPSAVGLTLVEQIPAGGVVITTVYGSYDAKGAFPAVMSKHVDLVGPFPQQYYGSCVPWD